MRFNKNELSTLAAQPGNKFDKEGVLNITERQEGFFRKTDGENSEVSPKRRSSLKGKKTLYYCLSGTTKVSTARWCRLRGNLLFYLKSCDQFSEPSGVIVLEKYRVESTNDRKEQDGFVFFLEFDDGLKQRLAAETEKERTEWIQSIQIASYGAMRAQLQYLREQIERKRGNTQDVDVDMLRMQSGNDIDITEVPICESAISCDNLLCDGNGRPPNPSVVVQVTAHNRAGWIKYGRTEVIERCSNPQFLCTITFRGCDGLHIGSMIKFTAYDVKEKVSQTAVPLGSAEIALGVIQDTTRLRIPLRSGNSNIGFITIATFIPEADRKLPRSPAKSVDQQAIGHRRSQSLPPKLGVKLFVPQQSKLPLVFINPNMHTYRLQSGLGGDISVHELMMESRICFIIPQQLLSIFILREKELLQEISGMGELGGEWRNKQMDLLDKHLKLLKDYSQAKQNLQHYSGYFKQSAKKADEGIEFAPLNLHLQRMWAHNDTLKKSDYLDVITVGAFTQHTGRSKTGGLIKLLHQIKESPSKIDQHSCKVEAANDVVQAIKHLRKEIVDIMSQLLLLAKTKNSKGMLPLCTEMMNKTRSLLTMWEPCLVEEAFEFIERHRIIDDPENNVMPMSPFKKITQQLGTLDLKSPELEDFATPLGPAPDLWPSLKTRKLSSQTNQTTNLKTKSPSATDINTIVSIQNSVQSFTHKNSDNNFSTKDIKINSSNSLNKLSSSLPNSSGFSELKFNETHFDVNGEISTSRTALNNEDNYCGSPISNKSNKSNEPLPVNDGRDLENDFLLENPSIVLGHNGAFLDTRVMSSCPSANYYKPTEEPEPLDLTQLNIEASVMCLVSKVKFLCGRCGSPAVRLRQPRGSIKRGFNSLPPDIVTSQPTTNSSDLIERVSLNPETPKEMSLTKIANINSKDLNLALTQAVGEVTRKVTKGNKFTDGLDLSMTTDWASELRPSMRKLRHAMDGLLKTARLMHSVQRLQQDSRKISTILSIMYRRDICFSQALTSLVTGLMCKLWGTNITENFIHILCNLGPLAYFEGLLSLYGGETDMWGDMSVAVEDLATVRFTLVRSNWQRGSKSLPIPRVMGSRQAINVLLPIPDNIFCMLPTKEMTSFTVTPVFFNIGVNEKATISEALGYTKEQHRSNWDNFDRLKQYQIRYKKLQVNAIQNLKETILQPQATAKLLNSMEEALRNNTSKNIKILHLAQDVCRSVQGIRFTSCKSAKDRTAMAVTLEECKILQQEFHLPGTNLQNVLNTMRSEGTRSENTMKNIGLRKYAFNLPQILALPQLYRPPAGSYGKAQT